MGVRPVVSHCQGCTLQPSKCMITGLSHPREKHPGGRWPGPHSRQGAGLRAALFLCSQRPGRPRPFLDFLVPEGGRMGRGAVLVGGGGDGGGRSGGRDGSMGSGGPGLGRNPSKGENLRGLQEKPRQSQGLLSLGRNTGSRPTNCHFSSPLQMYRD